MKTNDSGRTTADVRGTRGSRSALADQSSGNEAGSQNRPQCTEAASTAYALYYVDAAPALHHSTNPAIHLRQRALLALAGSRQRERELLALLDELVVAQWVAKRDAQRRAQLAGQPRLALQLPMPQRIGYADEDDAYNQSCRDGDRDLTD
ncbi:hypothetical protein [Burkholderia sp. Ac-20365]|uniref:hypothetical protein n=1 Tax=Burkholderia sp. Ac-20365 TaxID=2703897 RepID=UPI00197B28CD|nr:hypothetical protein [Burkholderia sp. Ac-20365]MBN3767578.1 hypothetical protein [Burkholderia sp. Ac-20365]